MKNDLDYTKDFFKLKNYNFIKTGMTTISVQINGKKEDKNELVKKLTWEEYENMMTGCSPAIIIFSRRAFAQKHDIFFDKVLSKYIRFIKTSSMYRNLSDKLPEKNIKEKIKKI